MDVPPTAPRQPDADTHRFYVAAMKTLDRASIPYLVGGGYAMAHYSGIARNTKDLDLFIRPRDRDRTLTTLTAAGYRTEFFYPFWISKALCDGAFIDILYNSGNGLCPVDDEWFTHAIDSEVLGYRTRLAPAEEQLWSKAFVQDRDRYDGADVAHLILSRGSTFDWERLLRRFAGGHEPVLLAHVILFRYSYPSERRCVPQWVVERLEAAAAAEASPPERVNGAKLCRGTFLAQKSYGQDVRSWGFTDGRVKPYGPLSVEDLEQLPND
jgi:hypothetical protein